MNGDYVVGFEGSPEEFERVEAFVRTLVHTDDEPAALKLAHGIEFKSLSSKRCLELIEVWNDGIYLCEFFEQMTGSHFRKDSFCFPKQSITKEDAVFALEKVGVRISLYGSDTPFCNHQHRYIKEWWVQFGSKALEHIKGVDEVTALDILWKILKDVRTILFQVHKSKE